MNITSPIQDKLRQDISLPLAVRQSSTITSSVRVCQFLCRVIVECSAYLALDIPTEKKI